MNSLQEHFLRQIPTILRPASGALPFPYLVPGGIFLNELWDWDSFWLTKGTLPLLAQLDPADRDAFLEHARGSWKNFFENQAPNGAIPIMAKPDRPDFFRCTEEGGIERNQAKPVFAQFALDLATHTGDFTWIEPYFDRLLSFYNRWFTRYGTGLGLVVWGSDVAIGTDNDPTVFGRPEFSSAHLLLNCLLFRDLSAAADIATALARPDDARRLTHQAEVLQSAIQRECWDEQDGFFYTVDVQSRDHRSHYLPDNEAGMAMSWSSLPLKVKSFTGFLPLWCGIADPRQAGLLVEKHLRNPAEFLHRFGLASLARSERMYEPSTNSANPSNWLGPVWIVASYMVYEGLLAYGYHDEARQLAERTVTLLTDDLAATGTLHECYHPETGAPNFNADFLSWNVLAGLMTKSLVPRPASASRQYIA